MAKPYEEITKSKFRENYNVVKILNDKSLIMKQLQSFNPNNQAVAFAVKKQHTLTLEDVMNEVREGFKSINTRIDNLVKKNNLEE